MSSIVYMATNRVNGKRYIGVTSKGLSLRRRQHEQAPNNKRITCRYFHAAMKKHGAESFDWTVLVRCSTFEEGLQTEVRLIAEMKPEYNLTAGGQGAKGVKMTPEGRARWLEKMRGRKLTPEHIAKCAEARRGQKRTPEQRERMGAARRGKPFSKEHRRNLSLSHTGYKAPAETIEKHRANFAVRQKDERGRLL